MFRKLQFNKTFFNCCTKIGIALCLVMCCSMITHAQSTITDMQQKITAAKTYLNFAQGATCAEIEPFCTAIGASFPATTNTQAEAGNEYGCLLSQPNPEWYYLQIEDPGSLEITLTNSNNVDIDFVVYGPYGDLQTAQADCGSLQTQEIVDCSYDPQSTEIADIPNAQTGEVYILLITNFSNQATEIFVNQTGGMASTDCSILAPTITCPPNIDVACFSEVMADTEAVEFTINCGIEGVVTVGSPIGNINNSSCGESTGDEYRITYTVTDECDNVASCVQVFTINSEPPVINCPADVTGLPCDADLPAPETMLSGTSSCDSTTEFAVINVEDSGSVPAIFCAGDSEIIIRRTYTVEDTCGNQAQCVQSFTFVSDSEPPQIQCPVSVTVLVCGDTLPAAETMLPGTDNCDPATEFAVTDVVDSNYPGNFCEISDVITITRRYTVSDACGNEAICTQFFEFEPDLEGPTVTCPADVTLVCGDTLPAVETMLFGTDNCDTATEFVVTNVVDSDLPTSFCSGVNLEVTRTYTVMDVCENNSQCTQTFTFLPVEAPTITCLADTTVSCFADISVDISDVSFTTSCDIGATVSIGSVIPNGTFNCPGTTYTYPYTVEDDCGGTATCDRVFTIANDEPTITCPADTTVSCFADISVDISDVSFTTSCGIGATVSIGSVIPNGTFNCPGTTYTYSYTVEDACGRTATCNRVFTIANDGPTITCPAGGVVECAADISVDEDDVSYTTGCDAGATVSITGPVTSGTFDCPGTTYTYTYTVEDACGRTATCDRVFTVANEGPTITCPASFPIACFSDLPPTGGEPPIFTTSCSLTPGVSGRANDPIVNGLPNCSGTTYSYLFRITDPCGRVDTCEQVFTIENDGPMITSCPEDCPVACASDIRPGTPEYTTSCGVSATVTVSDPLIDGDPHCDGTTYTYTHTVTDGCGRTVSCEQVFTIVNECHLVDFDYDDHGNPLHPGTDIFDQYEDFTVTTDNPHRCVQLFDTGNPTSNDFDLGTPNEQYGGPGVGGGGANNTDFQGNALIVSKDCGVPNETEGQLIFTFDCSVTIKTVDLLDMKCGHSEIELYDEHHNLIEELPIPGYGVNSFNVFDVNVSGVYTMIVDLDCGGGVTAFKYCKDNAPGTDCEAPDLCEDYNLDFDNSGYHWTTNSTSGSFDVGNQNYSISISDDDNILEDTYESAGGLLVGIDPHDVHDEVVVCYNLSQVSDNVSFDIDDIEYKNYSNSSKQQEAVCVYGLLGDDPTQILPNISSLDGSVNVSGNCAEGTTDSAHSHDDESVLVEFDECIDKVVIVYGTGQNSPTHNPTYSKIIIGKQLGFNSEVCPRNCASCDGFSDNGDDDGDGVCNDDDVCPGGDDNQDRDGDGIPDACDDICYDYNIDHGGCGAGWQHGDESGTVELGLENISIDILDDDNILENTQADGQGLNVGIDPHTVDDELVVCYTLSESSANVVFDIVDLDFKNPKQQEAVCIFGTLGNNSTPILPTITSLDGSVAIDGNCAEGAASSSQSHQDESILVEFTECIDKITIVYGTGSNPAVADDPDYSGIIIGESIFSVEQCKDGCDEPCPIVDTGGGPQGDGDADDDGVCDGDDICPGGDDFMDTDGDGTPDFCDNDCLSLGDSDGDFICDDVDQCPGFDDNIDENNNGIPDGCDVECEDYTLDFAEHGYDWSGHSLMQSYTVGSQTFDVRIIDGDHILTSSHDRASGLAIGTNPHDVHDEVVICYSLSEVASNVRFDIFDLDYKTGHQAQQEAVCIYGTLGNDQTQIMPTISSLDGNVMINGNCAEAGANSSISGQDESILVEFTECIDKVTIVYGTGSNSPTHNPDHGKITIGHDLGFITEVCSNTCPELRSEDETNAYISLYPNPVYGNGNVTIEIDTEARGDAQVALTDALGRTVSSENIQLVNNLTIHQFSTNSLAAGVYFVQLQTKEWRTDGMKLVVVKP